MQSKRLMAVFFAVALFIVGIAGPASAQQFGLVNVEVTTGDILRNLKIGAAIPIVLGLCPNVNANVVVAAILAVAGGAPGDSQQVAPCDVDGGAVTIFQ